MNRRDFALGAAGVGLCAAVVEADEPPYVDRLRARIAAPVPAEHLHWDDFRFPATALGVPVSGFADLETATGLRLFDAAATEKLFGLVQMPHTWKEGSTVHPHVHWSPTSTNTGAVLWRLQYQIRPASGGAAWDFSAGWTTIDALDTAGGVAGVTQIASFAGIAMTDFKISALIHFILSRIGGDASDTYTADARLFEFDVHYQKDTDGSHSLFTK